MIDTPGAERRAKARRLADIVVAIGADGEPDWLEEDLATVGAHIVRETSQPVQAGEPLFIRLEDATDWPEKSSAVRLVLRIHGLEDEAVWRNRE